MRASDLIMTSFNLLRIGKPYLEYISSDKFKIIISLRRTQKLGDTGPHKNFNFQINQFLPDFLKILAKIECSICGTVSKNGLKLTILIILQYCKTQ